MKSVARCLLGLAACVLLSPQLQGAIITFHAPTTSVAPGANFGVAITVSPTTQDGYTSWVNTGFNLLWDPSVVTLQTLNPVDPTSPLPLSTANFNSPAAGQLRFTWADTAAPTDVPDGSTLFTLNFTAVGSVNSSTAITFDSLSEVGLYNANKTPKYIYPSAASIDGRISVVPEPVNCALAALGLLLLSARTVRFSLKWCKAHGANGYSARTR